MKRLLLLAIASLSMMSCSAEDTSPQHLYKDMYEKGEKLKKTAKVEFEFQTTYKNVNIVIYDVEKDSTIYVTSNSNFKYHVELRYYSKYIISFEREDDETIDGVDPYTYIYIENETDKKLVDEYEYKGCLLGYHNTFFLN